jgi:hypothetical protein
MPLALKPYQALSEVEWNAFVERSNEGTIFHRLDFLRYHGEKFKTYEHHVGWYRGQTLFGVMPLAIFLESHRYTARSPYGASYGGPVFLEPLTYAQSLEVMTNLLGYFKQRNISVCRLTLPISCCYERYCETFRFVLLEQGFQCVNRDISSVVNLMGERPIEQQMSVRPKRMIRKALEAGVVTVHRGALDDFWRVMEKTHKKLGITPTHSFSEFKWLCEHFPERIFADVAYLEKMPIAGIGFVVHNKYVLSSFYLGQDPEHQRTQALTLLISQALALAQKNGYRWFDFGTSSVGMKANPNIFEFKQGFGAIGRFRETYQWHAAE